MTLPRSGHKVEKQGSQIVEIQSNTDQTQQSVNQIASRFSTMACLSHP